MSQAWPERPTLGVIHHKQSQQKFSLTRHAPSEDIGFFVKHYWIIRWNLGDSPPHEQSVIPNPCVNLALERGQSGIFAPSTSKTSHLIQGQGSVFGIKFKPGGFYPFLGLPISRMRGEPLNVEQVLGADAAALEADILPLSDDTEMARRVERLLRPNLPARDDTVAFINDIIDGIAADRELTRVEQVSERAGVSVRKLQRLFDQYVGVGPKWVIQLYRLQNAAEILDHEPHQDWALLAQELGYYDQSHFIRDFKSILGVTPEEYVKGGG
ncbi:DUF6597 domain-containing transcriptional factor [Paenibacillus xanthanilyticus]|uniref:DUF6597 domain-containing transcriptional factor n=1 Tax=Paenibacillus xanthanilyticus TaxID=1783531 RepID=A0ABV8JY14_9BACL